MTAFEPFEVNIIASVSGKTIFVTGMSTNSAITGTLDSTNTYAPHVLVTNVGGNIAWVRMSSEAAPAVSQNDTPMPPNSVRLFTNPVPGGKCGLAVLVSVTTSPNTVYFTPGQGGV